VLKLFSGFRDFIMRGNIVDLAVGVVIGVAFNALVTALTNDFIKPLIQLVSGGKAFSGSWKIGHSVFAWGDFVTQIINFLLVAAALYFLVVLPINKLNEGRATLVKRFGVFGRGRYGQPIEEEPPPLPPDIALLTQIRDSLLALEDRSVLTPSQRSAPLRPGEPLQAGDVPETA
jgi:large conductance mechanosensitive channel